MSFYHLKNVFCIEITISKQCRLWLDATFVASDLGLLCFFVPKTGIQSIKG